MKRGIAFFLIISKLQRYSFLLKKEICKNLQKKTKQTKQTKQNFMTLDVLLGLMFNTITEN